MALEEPTDTAVGVEAVSSISVGCSTYTKVHHNIGTNTLGNHGVGRESNVVTF